MNNKPRYSQQIDFTNKLWYLIADFHDILEKDEIIELSREAIKEAVEELY